MDKAWAGVLLPTIALGFFAAIPYLDRSREGQGVWFGTKNAVKIATVTAIYAFFVCALLVAFDAGDRTKFEYATRWIPSCERGVDGVAVEHQGTPCLLDAEGAKHVGMTGTNDLSSRFQFYVPFPAILGIDDKKLDWPGDVDHIPVPFNDVCFQWHGQHLWCDMHINLPVTMTQQVIPLIDDRLRERWPSSTCCSESAGYARAVTCSSACSPASWSRTSCCRWSEASSVDRDKR